MEQKRISLLLDEDCYNCWKKIADEEYRRLSKQTLIAIKAYMSQYEQERRTTEAEE